MLETIASNQMLFGVLAHAYGTDHFGELLRRTSPPLEQLLARGRQAGVVRADVAATDFAPILEMLSAITGDAPGMQDRYMGLILAGLRPGHEPLSGEPPTEEYLLQAASDKGRAAASAIARVRQAAMVEGDKAASPPHCLDMPPPGCLSSSCLNNCDQLRRLRKASAR